MDKLDAVMHYNTFYVCDLGMWCSLLEAAMSCVPLVSCICVGTTANLQSGVNELQ